MRASVIRRRWSDLVVLATFLGLVGAAHAQQPSPPRHIGVLLTLFSPESSVAEAFREGLRDAGYVEGRDLLIDWRFANGDYALVSKLAADLVSSKVDVIVVQTTPATLAVKRATSTIPVVMSLVGDPVGSGLVANLAHPDGNITGLSTMATELSAKRLQLLKEAIPRATRVAVLWNPDTPTYARAMEELKAVAPSLSIDLIFVRARAPNDIAPAFSTITRTHTHALYIIPDAFFFTHRAAILKLASEAKVPVIYGERHFADAGALMSYGPNIAEMFRRSAGYVVKILKGTKPADLPIEQPTQFELVVNMRTAKALGIAIPESILVRADDVIR